MIIHSTFPAIEIPDAPLSTVVLGRAAERGDRPAMIDGATGRSLSHADIADGVRRVAAGLAASGLRPRDVVAIMLPNLPEFALTYHGALVAGATVTTLSPLGSVEEVRFQLEDTRARFLVTVPPCLEVARAAARGTDVARVHVLGLPAGDAGGADGVEDFAELLTHGDEPPEVPVDPARDVAALLYSSGTTGRPKGVALTHRALVAALTQMTALVPMHERDRLVCPIPFFHIAGQAAGMNAVLRAGATVVTVGRFDVEAFLAIIQEYRITAVAAAPPIVRALAHHPLVDRYDLSSVERVVCGSAPLPAELQTACAQRLGRLVGQAYGLTETGLIIAAAPHDGRPPRPGAAGMLCPSTEARVVDPERGCDVTPGAVGELWVRGPQTMSGYLGRPEETAAMLDAEGWLHTGDLVRIEDDWIVVVDRLKELIKYKGFQVAPAELEALLGTHPAVADVAVTGRPDDDAGELPVAHVVRCAPVEADELIEFVAARVSPQHRVRAVEFVDAIPRSPAGRILRRELRPAPTPVP